MKPVYKCDYCSKMGTAEEISEHEPNCTENYDRKSCHTCIHKSVKVKDKNWIYECKADKDIPDGMVYEFCDLYERKEKTDYNNLGNLFGDIFGNFGNSFKK